MPSSLTHHFPRLIGAVFLGLAGAATAQISVPQSMFRSEDFRKSFVGSYGFLAPVEPKVSRTETDLLVRVRELFGKGQFRAAESELSRFIRSNDGKKDAEGNDITVSPAMVFVLGTLYQQAGKFDDARRAYLEAIRRYPNFRRAHLNLAYTYAQQEQIAKAMPHLQTAIELGENSHRAFGLLGFGYLSEENPVAAESAYRQAILLKADAQDWQNGLANSLLQQEKYEEAAALLGSLIAKAPNNRELYLQRAKALLAMEKSTDAAIVFEALRLRGLATSDDLTLLGNLYLRDEQGQLALLSFLAAMDADPQIDVARATKSARILADNGFPEKSRNLIAKARRKAGEKITNQQRVEMLLVDVAVARETSDLEASRAGLEELFKFTTTNGQALMEKGYFHEVLAAEADDEDVRINELATAREQFQLAAKTDEAAYQGNLALGQQYARERRFIEALPALDRALELKPSASLRSWVANIKRAADRQQLRIDREEKERRAKELKESAE